jgi:hypothetical protein
VEASREALREVVAKAARDPAAHGDLTLTYQRGHELSGTTRFELRADGRYALTREDRRGRRETSSGELDAEHRDVLLAAIEESGLLDVPSSSRNIGDDEEPILVELRYDAAEHRLRIWAGDARANPGFNRFETILHGVLRGLSDAEARGGA